MHNDRARTQPRAPHAGLAHHSVSVPDGASYVRLALQLYGNAPAVMAACVMTAPAQPWVAIEGHSPAPEKVEMNQGTTGGPVHDTEGPLKISRGRFFTKVGRRLLQVAHALHPSRDEAPHDTEYIDDVSTVNVHRRRP
ncbi:hypothetical protein BJV78DRAFT_1157376 [Lactifluus subvellereus]|nr:hypothetical protein BJV78DRAFT_1157376 [Lactifluus subvellereus]